MLDSVAKMRHLRSVSTWFLLASSGDSQRVLTSPGLAPHLQSHADVAKALTCHKWHWVPLFRQLNPSLQGRWDQSHFLCLKVRDMFWVRMSYWHLGWAASSGWGEHCVAPQDTKPWWSTNSKCGPCGIFTHQFGCSRNSCLDNRCWGCHKQEQVEMGCANLWDLQRKTTKVEEGLPSQAQGIQWRKQYMERGYRAECLGQWSYIPTWLLNLWAWGKGRQNKLLS